MLQSVKKDKAIIGVAGMEMGYDKLVEKIGQAGCAIEVCCTIEECTYTHIFSR